MTVGLGKLEVVHAETQKHLQRSFQYMATLTYDPTDVGADQPEFREARKGSSATW